MQHEFENGAKPKEWIPLGFATGATVLILTIFPPTGAVPKYLGYSALPLVWVLYLATRPAARTFLGDRYYLFGRARIFVTICALSFAVFLAGLWFRFMPQDAQLVVIRAIFPPTDFNPTAGAASANVTTPSTESPPESLAVPVDVLRPPRPSPEMESLRKELADVRQELVRLRRERAQETSARPAPTNRDIARDTSPPQQTPASSSPPSPPPRLTVTLHPTQNTSCSMIGKSEGPISDREKAFLPRVPSLISPAEGLLNRLVFADPETAQNASNEVGIWLNDIVNHVRSQLGNVEAVDVGNARSSDIIDGMSVEMKAKLSDASVGMIRRLNGATSCLLAIEANLKARQP